MTEIDPETHPAAGARRPWAPPSVTELPRLTQLTLATGPGVNEGPGFGGGSVVIP
ncbi:MAG TPA: hypothetical protein VF092_27865 [Longimicrobium sp.]